MAAGNSLSHRGWAPDLPHGLQRSGQRPRSSFRLPCGHCSTGLAPESNVSWSAASVADLYRCRWQIEVFFKQIKQSLQLCDFLGNSANAVRWQVWTALLLYVLMRFLCVIGSWSHSFTRLFTLLRATLWRKIDLWDLLGFYGIAGGDFRYLATPQSAYLPGFAQ